MSSYIDIFKMADYGYTGSESSRNVDYHAIFSGEVGEILVKLDSGTRSEVVDELVDRLDAETLKDTRMKIFQRIVDEWSLIARKGLPRIALDIVEFLNFYGDDDAYFPYKLIKRKKPTRKGKGGMKKRNVSGAKQTLINFTSKNKPPNVEGGKETYEKDGYEKSGGEGSLIINEEDVSSADGDTQSGGSDSEESVNSEGVRTSDDNNDAPDLGYMDDSILIPPSGRVSRVDTLTPSVDVYDSGTHDNTANPGGQSDVTQSACRREISEPERDKQPVTNPGCRQGDMPPHPPVQVRTETKEVSSECSTRPDVHAPKPVVTIIRDLSSDNGFWDSQQGSNSSRNTAIAMTTQTEWDLWGSPLSKGGRSISPSRRAPECDCKYNVKVLNEWRKEADRRTEANEEKFKAKLNFLQAKVIEGEEERGKMRATIASLSKEVAANTATATEMKIRASDPYYGQAEQSLRNTITASQSTAAPIRSNNPLPQRPQNTTAKQRPNNSARGGPTSSTRSGTLSENPAPNVAPANPDYLSAHPNESKGPVGPSVISRPQISSNARGNANNMGRPQSGAPSGQQGNIPDRQVKRLTDMPIDNGPTRGLPNRPNTSAPVVANRDSTSGANRPKSVQVSRPSNDHRASFDLPQTGELSFSWSEDPISDVEIVAHTNEPPAPSQKGYSSYAHQNRYDIVRDALSDTLQREEAARREAGSSDVSVAQQRAGEKRVNDGYVDEPSEKESYVGVAAKYDWETENKRRRGNSGEHLPPIYGVKNTPQRDIFVRDLAYAMCSSPEDLEIRVKNHCRLRGVVLSFIKAFPIKSNCAKANCKITVSMEDVNNVLSESFWPQYVSARPWRLNPPNNAGNGNNDNRGLE